MVNVVAYPAERIQRESIEVERDGFKIQIKQKAEAILNAVTQTAPESIKELTQRLTETITLTEQENLTNFRDSTDAVIALFGERIGGTKSIIQYGSSEKSGAAKAKEFSEIAEKAPQLLELIKLRISVLEDEIDKIKTNTLFLKCAIGQEGGLISSSSGSLGLAQAVHQNILAQKSSDLAPTQAFLETLKERVQKPFDIPSMEEMASHIKKEALASQSLLVFAKEIGPHEQRYIPQLREKLNDLQNANSLDRSIHIEFARKLNLIAQEILASQAILDQNLKPTNDLLTYLEKQPAQANQSDLYLSPEMIKASSQLQSNAELFAETQLNSSLRRFRDPIENELALKTQRESLETNKEINGELISSQKQYLKDAEPHLKNLLNELGQINKSYKTLQAHSSSLNTELSNLNAKLNPSNVSSYWSWFTSSSSSAAAPTQLEDLKEVEPALNSVASVVEDVKEKESTISKNVRRSYAEVVVQGYQILDDSFGAGLEEAWVSR